MKKALVIALTIFSFIFIFTAYCSYASDIYGWWRTKEDYNDGRKYMTILRIGNDFVQNGKNKVSGVTFSTDNGRIIIDVHGAKTYVTQLGDDEINLKTPMLPEISYKRISEEEAIKYLESH